MVLHVTASLTPPIATAVRDEGHVDEEARSPVCDGEIVRSYNAIAKPVSAKNIIVEMCPLPIEDYGMFWRTDLLDRSVIMHTTRSW
ncbi:hypothetical protein F441_19333 [Phytophthora nicotianae CJ01A1]|uniref:Uncharacterized protein n=2 Tax=Phytophthora nicotianae TaxID=4792 RepID=W2K923_PHYNI|nr:hypothetical protein L915_18932 [Phytophthora nicotianae]ETL80895.1 hypothetical protein L917_18655 [Phytophthora nicotianae]ETP03753.1 hypothetical protein F441_19333 [Phytophthora nicotianae CJ01A1]